MPRTHSPEEKIEILKEHIIDGKPLGIVCEEHRIHPETFMKWQKELFEYGDLTFRRTPQDGMDYFHSYDLVVNWLSEAFRGQTLGVLGVSTGEIRRVCSYKPVEIAVSAGVVDVIFEETGGKAWHLEEQRSMTEKDLYRFASQHFSAAGEWRDDITDILLTSGEPYTGRREIRTPTGTYAPMIIDLTERDGPGRLAEIRESLDRGDSSVLLELVFLPLYGEDTDMERSRFVREVLRFEIDLYKQDRMPVLLLAATMIMSNREIDKTTFQELWEEVKMLRIFEYAREIIAEAEREKWEKKVKEEKVRWEKEEKEKWEKKVKEEKVRWEKKVKEEKEKGRLESARDMVMEALHESVGVVPGYLVDEVMSVSRPEVLKGLLRQTFKCREIGEFEKMLKQATRQPAE
ncbi:hypothetical protein QUF72_09360 [Desulfobacterales bacterium HSG2]|nr:hypothetical protein [Desulfobacterales bacterium HSG2]